MFQKWCEVTSCNGIIDWYQSKSQKYHFTFWTVTMLGMVSMSIFFTMKTIYGFVATPIITNYVTKVFHNKSIPQVTLCFNGGLNGTALLQANFSDELIYRLSDWLPRHVNAYESVSKEIKNYLTIKNHDVVNFTSALGYKCDDMVSARFLAGDPTLTNVACQDVIHFPRPVYGTCLLFNNNGHQVWPGLDGGVRFHLTAPRNSVAEVKADLIEASDRSMSFLLSVTGGFDFSMDKAKLIPIGMKTEITLHPIHYVRLPSGDPCERDKRYSNTNDCFHSCYSKNVFDSCGCVPLRFYDVFEDSDKVACIIFDEMQCLNYSESITTDCQKTCNPVCNEWIYDIALSSGPVNNLGQKDLKAVVWIGFNQMQYTKIEEVNAFTFDMVIADVGGQAGLWLGCSFITIIQGLYYLWITFWEKATNRKILKITPDVPVNKKL